MLSPTADVQVIPKNGNNVSPHGGESFKDFIQRQALKRGRKELAGLLDLSTKTIAKMRDGTVSASGETVTKWCQRDDDFAMDYFRHCGQHVLADPRLVKGISAAVSAIIAYRGLNAP